MVQVPSSCRFDNAESCILPEAAIAAATVVPSCELDLDQDQAAAVAAMALLAASSAGGSLGRRRSTCLRSSFAVWADSVPANGSAVLAAAAGSGGSGPLLGRLEEQSSVLPGIQ